MIDNSGPIGDPVDQVVASIMQSSRYGIISEDLIRRIASQEVKKRTRLREAIKSTKNKLHQVAGAYFDRPVDYRLCLEELRSAIANGEDDFHQACRRVMCYHSSTRERLPELDRFYPSLLADLPPLRRVLDLACGLNPLAIPWMGLPENVEYFAVDIYSDLIHFIDQFFSLAGVNGSTSVCDVIGNCPTHVADVAFVLKTLPCLEQVDKSAGVRLLDSIKAGYLVVSYPIHSLGGRRDKGMLENYTNQFNAIIAERTWSVKKYEYITELVFVVRK